MKIFWAGMMIALMLLTGCTGGRVQYQSEQNSAQWQGKNIIDLEQAWGTADQILHARNGTSYYVYTTNSGVNFFNGPNNNMALRQGGGGMYVRGEGVGNMNMSCTTLFTTDRNGVITTVQHNGHNCGGEWVRKSKPT